MAWSVADYDGRLSVMRQQSKMDANSYLQRLALTSNCSIVQDVQVGEKVKRAITELYSEDRDGVHCTDLTLCMRQALFRKLSPVELTMKQIGYFFDGSRRHETLQKLYGRGVAEKEVQFEGVKCTIDILDNGIPIEFKTTRAATAISEHWIRQLIFYMLAVESGKGILQIQRIMPSKMRKREEQANLFPAYVIQLDQKGREFWFRNFRERKSAFFEAHRSKDLLRAPIYRGENKWLCFDCSFKAECDRLERITG